jgi:hypothetical protein
MNLKSLLYNQNIFSIYVYTVAFLMIVQVIVHGLNEQFDWAIRKGFLELLPNYLHSAYFSLLFLLLIFSIVNVVALPILGGISSLIEKKAHIVIVSLLAAFTYYLFLIRLGDGII